ncbi:MAG TPA: hypothetical protein VHV75_01850 [Solirubrobacteraceae bacterium]|jgi:hypothetical protein|nr:hypothetical protein [Solirubrobacteraceae bacterium]
MSQPRSIRTIHEHDVCDVCSRTLLRGEQTEVFVGGGRRYSVCELCKPHALQEGWMREGAIPEFQGGSERVQRRRPLFGRRRNKDISERGVELQAPAEPRTLDDELSLGNWYPPAPAAPTHAAPAHVPVTPEPARVAAARDRHREPRHVHAIPTSGDHKIAVAVDVFNSSQHRRTVAGVARSLGAPTVNITPDATHASIVWIVVAWELCWYRYEVDLSDAKGHARLDGQGYELDELSEHERIGTASSDDSGALILI